MSEFVINSGFFPSFPLNPVLARPHGPLKANWQFVPARTSWRNVARNLAPRRGSSCRDGVEQLRADFPEPAIRDQRLRRRLGSDYQGETFSRNSRSGFALPFLSSGARVSLRLYPDRDDHARY